MGYYRFMKIFLLLICCNLFSFSIKCDFAKYQEQGCVEQNRELVSEKTVVTIPGFPGAYNPTIVENGEGYTLFFRFDEPKVHRLLKTRILCMTYIGMVDLNQHLEVISKPKILSMRSPYCEDPRVVAFKNKWILFFNEIVVSSPDKRVMRLAVIDPKTRKVEQIMTLPGAKTPIEKNWTPFVYKGTEGERLYFVYDFMELSIHQVFIDNNRARTKLCHEDLEPIKEIKRWKKEFGSIRGGAPLVWIDGEFWAFFHSFNHEKKRIRGFLKNHYYYHPGLLTLNFEEKKVISMTQFPLLYDGAFESEKLRCDEKWIVYPSGAIYRPEDDTVLVAFGENDSSIILVKYQKEILKKALVAVES